MASRQSSQSVQTHLLHVEDGGPGFNSSLGKRIDHYLKHGYKLLHVGQETNRDEEGKHGGAPRCNARFGLRWDTSSE